MLPLPWAECSGLGLVYAHSGRTLTHPELALKAPVRPQGPALILKSVLGRNPLPRHPQPQASTVPQPSSGWRDAPHSSPVPPLPAPGRPPPPPPPPINPRVSPSLEEGKRGRRGRRSCRGLGKGYGHSVIFLAYFLTTLSSLKRNRDRLTVRQFCRTGMGLYRAMVRALCAIDCLYILCAPGCPPCRLPPAPRPPPAPTTTPAAAPEPPPP